MVGFAVAGGFVVADGFAVAIGCLVLFIYYLVF
jgi:hypothetical protein